MAAPSIKACIWRLGILLHILASPVLAAEKSCTLHDEGNYYDLNPLSVSKDYQFQTDGGHSIYMNVCRGVTTEPWNTGLEDNERDIAGLVRRDHGDFAIGLVNTTLEMKDGGLLLRLFNGSPCPGMEERGSSNIRFACDTSVYSAGKPALLSQFPSDDEKACHYEFEWRTHYACPTGERGFFGGLIVFLTTSAVILLMVFIVLSTLYNRYVLRLSGFDQVPKFTASHCREIIEVCVEFIRSSIDYLSAAFHTRTDRGYRNFNSASHHWTSRDEVEAMMANDPLEPDPEDVEVGGDRSHDTGAADGDRGTIRL